MSCICTTTTRSRLRPLSSETAQVNCEQHDAYSGRIIYEIFYCSVITCFLPENVAELDSRTSSVTMEQRCRSICASGLHIGLLAIQYTQACSAPDFEPARKLPTMTRRSQLFIADWYCAIYMPTTSSAREIQSHACPPVLRS